ncbi:MAG: DMT family transporter [Candidatus Dormibacteraeota bacterium]|nr:DMT family transporter [Candidatus Dormibacteraeota bacterium]
MVETLAVLAMIFTAGIGFGLQALLLGAIRVRRGLLLAVQVSLLGTFAGLTAILATQQQSHRRLFLAVAAVASAAALVFLVRGLPRYYGVVGLLGLLYLIASAAGVSRLGVGVTVAGVVAGQMLSSILLDQAGALGVARRQLTAARVLGSVMVVLGVALIRLG